MLDLDVSALQPAAVACSVHKWLLGPYGVSLLYLSPQLRSRAVPLEYHERALKGSFSAEWDEDGAMNNAGYPLDPVAGAARLDAGGGYSITKMCSRLAPLTRQGGPTQFCCPCCAQRCRWCSRGRRPASASFACRSPHELSVCHRCVLYLWRPLVPIDRGPSESPTLTCRLCSGPWIHYTSSAVAAYCWTTVPIPAECPSPTHCSSTGTAKHSCLCSRRVLARVRARI